MRRSVLTCSLAIRLSIFIVASTMLGVGCAEQAQSPTAPDDPARLFLQAETGTIQIVQGGVGQGTITSRPAGIACTLGSGDPSGTCEASFAAGTKVKLKADAAPNSKFEGWAPVTSCPKPNNLTVVAGRTHSCQPVFSLQEPAEFLLQAFQEGSGRVVSEPAGIDCTQDVDAGIVTGQCANIFPNGSIVTLTAIPLDGWIFFGWTGEDRDCEDGVVTMDGPKLCTAVFIRDVG